MLTDSRGELEVINLARSHARVAHVRFHQLSRVPDFPTSIASVIVGMNDALGTFSLESFRMHYEAIVAFLAHRADMVLTATLADISCQLGLSSEAGHAVRRHIEQANEVIRAASARYETVCLDAGSAAGQQDIWLSDGLHPNVEGHRRIATAFAKLIVSQKASAIMRAEPSDRYAHEFADLVADLAAHPDPNQLRGLFSPNAELWTPASPTPFLGPDAVSTVLQIFLSDVVSGLTYHCRLVGTGVVGMMFSGKIAGIRCDGFDLIEFGPDSLIRRFTVYLRPLPAISAMARAMAVALSGRTIAQSDHRQGSS
jgi:lysophospholipase L1-like esterase